MRRLLLVLLGLIVVGAGITVAISFYQPPMRLMPAPAVFLDGRTNIFSDDPARAPEPRDRSLLRDQPRGRSEPATTGATRVVPGDDLHAGVVTIRIGEDGTTWDRIYEWSTRAGDDQRPFLHLETSTNRRRSRRRPPLSPDAEAWFAAINDALAESRDHDIIIYVHGANTNLERAAGQAAQLQHFTGRNSVVLLFNWPTAENFLRYSRDMVTAAGSAPQLARLIELLVGKHRRREDRCLHLQRRRHRRQQGARHRRPRRGQAWRAAGSPRRDLSRRPRCRLPRLRRRYEGLRRPCRADDRRGEYERQRAEAVGSDQPRVARRTARHGGAQSRSHGLASAGDDGPTVSSCCGCGPRTFRACRTFRTRSGTRIPG